MANYSFFARKRATLAFNNVSGCRKALILQPVMRKHPSIEHLESQRLLLQMEYAAEREAYRRAAAEQNMERRVRKGEVWFPLRVGKTFYNSLNQYCLEVMRMDAAQPEHVFEHGRAVNFFVMRGSGKAAVRTQVSGTVNYVDGNRMLVIISADAPLSALAGTSGQVGVQLDFDATTYALMFEALNRIISTDNHRLVHLRNLFHGNTPAQFHQFAHLRFPWLNASQERAVNQVLRAKDVAVVHGPPGTGKTTTLVEAIYETLHRESQVLVCAQSNMAVDWISEKLVDHGVSVLRIGNPTRVNDKMLAFTYERQFENHPDYPTLWQIRKNIRDLRARRKGSTDNLHQKLERLKSRETELTLRIHTQLMNNARVVASTLTGAASQILRGEKFTTLFIDEAAQALEAACWIAIRRASRVVFAGDHCQLPPTVKSLAALRGGLGTTLMERIVANKPEVVTLLTRQYRMSDAIMQFSNQWFYHGMIESAPEVSHRNLLDYDTPMVWINTDEAQTVEQQQEGGSLLNAEEAHMVVQTLQQYIEKIGTKRMLDERIDVAVISPYRAQVQRIRKLLGRQSFFKPFKNAISIDTVDGFQGQERDVVFISMVRANNSGDIGFLRDLRRMNVAITRARMKLIIVGSVQTLCKHPFYQKLQHYISGLNGQQNNAGASNIDTLSANN